ncbi:MAG: esterase family protein [Alicyclobacillaceae bacterium]|nr:esterase family protein [Alicyclobacillaceae bacterium]
MEPPVRRIIKNHQLYSAHLREERTIKICLPPGYDENRRYPVLYCHDGAEFFTHGRIATIANGLIAEGRLQPLIIVGITVARSQRTDEYAPDGARHEAYLAFVSAECMPWVEARYPVDPHPGRRFMAGVSLGAAVSLALCVRHPASFSRLILFSGAFYPSALALIREARPLPGVAAWMVVGRQETAVETPHGAFDFLSLNRSARDLLAGRGVDVEYREVDGRHTWGFWQAQLPSALEWVRASLDRP